MGWSIVGTEGHGCNFSYWVPAGGTSTTRGQMMVYYNDTGKPVSINSCFMYFSTGSGTYGSYSGAGKTYYITASITDSTGKTVSSSEQTINNISYNSSYDNMKKIEWTFSEMVLVNPGATVYVQMTFRVPNWSTAVLCAGTWDSSYYGGSVSTAGAVRIYTSSGWKTAIPYVYNGGWKQAIPYVYNGGWKISS